MKKKKMDNLYNYLTDPTTIINIVVVIFSLWATRANLNNKIKKCEEDIKELKENNGKCIYKILLINMGNIKEIKYAER